ncbi:hypothetical protein LTR86_004026 [Recurvomyces mirabilis]|nr:hypothetical protein LTR86_004026 [Recurvomyces mirabilis]
MAESHANGNTGNGADVEMKMEAANETSMQALPDATNAQPPPQSISNLPAVIQPEQTLAAPTPPAASTRPNSMPPARPAQPIAHGGPTRQFLNQHLTPHLLEGMKYIAMHEPDKPLLWLSEFLRDRSKEVEG